MQILAWSTFAVCVVAIVGGVVYAVVHGLRSWRALRRLQRTVGAGMVEVTRGVDGIEARLARMDEHAAGMEQAAARLQRSLATFGILMAAAGDARGALAVLPLLRR